MPPRADLTVLDPTGERHGLPTYPWGHAPDGLFTRRQLRELGRSPGHDPVAQLLGGPRGDGTAAVAWLYDLTRTKPKRTVTAAVLASVQKALQARRTCPDCGHDVGYQIPRRIGACADCDPLTWGVPA